MISARTGSVGIVTFGVVLGVIHLLGTSISAVGVVTTLPFVLMASALVYAGVWLARSEQYGDDSGRVLLWVVGAAVTFGAVALIVLLSMRPPSGVPPSPLVDMLTAGALAGALVGLYDAQSRDRLAALEVERDRVEAFARKAESLNRYGKALNQSRDVFEVSALAIEVLELMIGSRDAAVVLVDDDATTIVDSTVPDRYRSTLERAAEAMADGEPMEVSRCPQDVDEPLLSSIDAGEILVVPVPTDAGGRVVLMALPGDDDPYTEEDLDLLASLSAHVGTALSRVDVDVTRTGG